VDILAKGFQARVELLRVYEPIPPEAEDILRGIYPYDIVVELREQAQEYLEGIAAPLRQNGLSVSSIVREGSPAICIIREAEKEPNTLIAMTTHGWTGVNRWLLGSVTD
jgi:nucleotide-binding universal stress UspA family protein